MEHTESLNAGEIWQVDVGGEIYEAEFSELTQWIFEGALLPQDKVRRGNLRWIEARKVPALNNIFTDKESGAQPPNFSEKKLLNSKAENEIAKTSVSDFAANEKNDSSSPLERVIAQNAFEREAVDSVSGANLQTDKNADFETLPKNDFSVNEKIASNQHCSVHMDSAAEYLCKTCENFFCRMCPSSYGGSVKICPFCGAMCQSIKKFSEQKQKEFRLTAAETESFGFADFSRAFSFPFKHKTSLIFGAALFAFFSFGQSAAVFGGMFMIFAALFCAIASNMLTFGILANTVENFSQGKLDTNFMPDFDDFSLWDDVVHPFFLSIGVYISSFGPFILVCIISVYLMFSSMTMQANAVQSELTKIPGTDYYDAQKTVHQSEEVRRLLESVRQETERNIIRQKVAEAEMEISAETDEETQFAELNEMIEESRKAQLESIAVKSPEFQEQQFNRMFRNFLNLAAPLVVLGFITLLWGAFYFPAACAVAGYTRSFVTTINPAVGLDTIKRLGADYLKILLMCFLMGILIGGAGLVLYVVFSPFDLPRIGNLPVKIFSSIVAFYFSVVFSCVLGYALFKNSSKLKLYR